MTLPKIARRDTLTHWAARRDWVTNGRPNFAKLRELYGECQVPVAESDTAYFSDQKRTTMRFSEFLDAWQTEPERKLYCKDWHFVQANPQYRAYDVLPHLSDDWINLFYDDHPEFSDDYRFSYMGGEGSWTPFHEDVYRSYSWSANICGEKHWLFVPPGQTHLFTDACGNWIYNLLDYDTKQFPHAHKLQIIEAVQRPGETVFVPSGWWHQVRNVGDTISINHNWANEFNILHMYQRLRSDLDSVLHALRDVADMDGFDEHAQVVLRADSGTDYSRFFRFVEHIAKAYLEHRIVGGFDGYFTSTAGVVRALERIAAVLGLLSDDRATVGIQGLRDEIARLEESVRECLR
ncbi:Clavaminate synthase-like protein [Linderina pennispora]|uniref:Clavaminate synthase-like protein n=1 Tax=Linderina pennispora TaxID=61395 RepID=A0A1Y1WGK3_9FUNG|nr:Clavaminate synthase-like protein [Linderina pennispora]ORX72663.1 Clavaminate synthase-like protein [Linderina pennispora]